MKCNGLKHRNKYTVKVSLIFKILLKVCGGRYKQTVDMLLTYINTLVGLLLIEIIKLKLFDCVQMDKNLVSFLVVLLMLLRKSKKRTECSIMYIFYRPLPN